jgi:hypothetical protein
VILVVGVAVTKLSSRWISSYATQGGADDSWDFFTEPDPSNGCKSPSPLAEETADK